MFAMKEIEAEIKIKRGTKRPATNTGELLKPVHKKINLEKEIIHEKINVTMTTTTPKPESEAKEQKEIQEHIKIVHKKTKPQIVKLPSSLHSIIKFPNAENISRIEHMKLFIKKQSQANVKSKCEMTEHEPG